LKENSALSILENNSARGIKGAVQKKVNKFLVKMFSFGKNQTKKMPVQSSIEDRIKDKPL